MKQFYFDSVDITNGPNVVVVYSGDYSFSCSIVRVLEVRSIPTTKISFGLVMKLSAAASFYFIFISLVVDESQRCHPACGY